MTIHCVRVYLLSNVVVPITPNALATGNKLKSYQSKIDCLRSAIILMITFIQETEGCNEERTMTWKFQNRTLIVSSL